MKALDRRLLPQPLALLVLALSVTLTVASNSPARSAAEPPRRGVALGTATASPAAAAAGSEIDWDAAGDEALRYLTRYLRFDTSNPPGRVIEAGGYLRQILESEEIQVTWFDSDPGQAGNLMARVPADGEPAGKPLMLLHHMDVVPADADRWGREPFAGEIADGMVWGRGAMDMKGLGIIHLMTLLLLQRHDVPLERDVVLLAVADEEVGGARGLNWMVENHRDRLDVAYVFDEGGFGARDVLADDRLVFNVSVAEKKIVWLELVAEGIAGHGSQPHEANPNDRLVRALERVLRMREMGRPPAVVEELRRRVGELADNKFTNAITHSTQSLTSLTSGVGDPPRVNVIPSVARATVDARLLPGVAPRSYLRRLRQVIDDPSIDVEVTYQMSDTPVSDWDTRLFQTIEETVGRFHPEAVVTPSPIPYGTDSNTLRQLGVGAYGFTPMVVSLDIVSSMHSDAERIPVDSFREGIRIFYEIVEGYAGRR